MSRRTTEVRPQESSTARRGRSAPETGRRGDGEQGGRKSRTHPRAKPSPEIRWLEELSARDADAAGGKGANLGELLRLGIPVPPGFVVAADAFRQSLEAAGLRQAAVDRLAALNVDDAAALKKAAAELQRTVREAPIPDEIRRAIAEAYHDLARRGAPAAPEGRGKSERRGAGEPFVAVRSSATAEDMPGTSFAGMNETFLNVRGEEALIEAVRGCWASLYGARVVFYRRKQQIPEEKMGIAVVVQQMVDSDAAGVMFTVNPANNDRRTVVVEGAFGLGDTVVSGSVSPDHWELNKDTLEVTQEQIREKRVRTYRDEQGRNQRQELSPQEGRRPCLTDAQVKELADLGRQIEAHYGSPQDIEWAVADDQIQVVQSRPVTTLSEERREPEEGNTSEGDGRGPNGPLPEVLVRGLGASPGLRTGPARVLTSLAESEKLHEGDVLVTRMTEPDWAPLMKKAAAIVTDEGGMTAHAAIVSRELGIPCVVGTQEATRRIPDGTTVTVDAQRGVVYRGTPSGETGRADDGATERESGARPVAPSPRLPVAPSPTAVTATRVYVNLAQTELAEKVASEDVDGVGLLRIEFMVQEITQNTHPRKLLREGRGDEFRDRLADHLAAFARAFAPRPVVARTTDFRSNEYRNMAGGDEIEPEEANPMLGYRGAYRYVHEPDLFRLELHAFRRVREEQGLKNLILMLPFVRTLSDLRACRRLMDEVGLTNEPAFPLWVMAEVPSILYQLPEYVREGVNGVSIGSNDLTQLILGVDRDSQMLAPLFNERDPAVLGAIRDIISRCRQLGIPCSICGQAPSVYPELTEKLVEWGIDSISVNPDVIDRTRRIVAAAEQRILLDGARSRHADHHGEQPV
jgi:pyruvate,water dikinase